MYFNTLKVSTVEQSADSVSARGGHGNPELITWDFGKEITVNLEDALYSPASQSLMWGGKFGIKKTKIYGVWNPFIYPTDRYGRQSYITRTTVEESGPIDEDYGFIIAGSSNIAHYFTVPYYIGTDKVFVKITSEDEARENVPIPDNAVVPHQIWFSTMRGNWEGQYTLCQKEVLIDGENVLVDYLSYSESWITQEGTYSEDEQISYTDETEYFPFVCPCDGALKYSKIEPNEGHYKYYHDRSTWQQDQLIKTDYNCPNENIIHESDEISRSVGKYTFSENKLDDAVYWNGALLERATLSIDNFGKFDYHAYEFVSKQESGQDICYYKDIDFCDNSAIKCTTEKVDAYGYIWENSDLKMNSMEGNQDVYYLRDVDLRFRIRNDTGLKEVSLEYNVEAGNNYQAKIDVYKVASFTTTDERGFESTYKKNILVGTFYIIDDWNLNGAPPQQFVYEIDNGLENVDYLERMEYCRAKQTFAIDTDKNLRCNTYRYDKSYNTTPLTVFLNPRTMFPYEPNAEYYQTKDGQILEGNFAIIKQNEDYYKWTRSKAPDYSSLGARIIVDAEHFPGAYKLVGETYARSYVDGKDQRYQFEIPLCKLSSNTNLTLEAAGEPTTFSMSFKVLRNDSGEMMRLTQYSVAENEAGSTDVVATERIDEDFVPEMGSDYRIEERRGDYVYTPQSSTLTLHNPTTGTVVYIDQDSDAPNVNSEWGGLSAATADMLGGANGIIDNYRVPQEGSSEETPIYNESLKSGVNLSTQYPTKVVVSQSIVYDRAQDVYLVMIDSSGHEREVEGSHHLEPIEGTITSTKFLLPDEYAFTAAEQGGGD